MMSPRLAAKPTSMAQLRCPLAASRAHDEADRATSLGACSGSHRESPPSMPPTTRWSCTTPHRQEGREPRAATRRPHPMTQLAAPKATSKMATNDASSAPWGSRPRPVMATTTIGKRAASVWGTPLSPHATSGVGKGHLQITSRGFLRRFSRNHAYPVRHKHKDCGMMWSFMTSGSLIWGAEHDGGPEGSHDTPFPKENAIMTVLGGPPLIGEAPHVQLEPQGLDSRWWGPRGRKDVTALDLFPLH
jgi:hypothetical protein